MSRISPQGYIYGEEPESTNPFWDESYASDLDATATVDNNTGVPSVEVTKITDEQNVTTLHFAFHNLKGNTGEKGETGATGQNGATPNISATATVNENTGVPGVEVTRTGTTENPVLNFNFTNLKGERGEKGDTGATGETGAKGDTGDTGAKGEKGDTGATPNITATATVDNTSGTPAVNVTKSGTAENPVLSFDFTGLKGETGATGNTGATPNITASATVDNTSGTPAVSVTKSGTAESPVLSFDFTGLKGEPGTGGSGAEWKTFTSIADLLNLIKTELVTNGKKIVDITFISGNLTGTMTPANAGTLNDMNGNLISYLDGVGFSFSMPLRGKSLRAVYDNNNRCRLYIDFTLSYDDNVNIMLDGLFSLRTPGNYLLPSFKLAITSKVNPANRINFVATDFNSVINAMILNYPTAFCIYDSANSKYTPVIGEGNNTPPSLTFSNTTFSNVTGAYITAY